MIRKNKKKKTSFFSFDKVGDTHDYIIKKR